MAQLLRWSRLLSLWGRFFSTIFNALYEQCLNCLFSIHAIRTVHDNFVIVTHTLLMSTKNILYAVVIRDCHYLPPLSQLQFLFTNELSASGIVVLCNDQKFINVSHEKIDIKIKIVIFSNIESKSNET